MVAVNRAARCVNEAFHFVIAGGHQQVDGAGQVAGIGSERVFNRPRHGAERRLMRDEIHAVTGALAGFQIADVAADEFAVFPARGSDLFPDFLEVPFLPGREIVEADDLLPELEQCFDNVRADESGRAGHQPGLWFCSQFNLQVFVGGHFPCTVGHTSSPSIRTGWVKFHLH